jgi:hypothetical protein
VDRGGALHRPKCGLVPRDLRAGALGKGERGTGDGTPAEIA